MAQQVLVYRLTGSAAALGMARSPMRVLTPAGPLDLRLEDEIFLRGPAAIVAEGWFLPTETLETR